MGFARLRVADPMRYRDSAFFATEAGRMAWDAADVLEAREEHPTLDAALADALIVAGTATEPPDGHAVLAPRALAARLVEEAGRGPVVLLLGQEDIGLTREILARCQVLGSIPSSPAYPSLNLAAAAVVFLYEIRLAALAAEPAAGGRAAARAGTDEGLPPAQAELEGFYERLTSTLDAVGFFEGSGRAHMVRELRRIFNRALLTRREVRILEGILHSVRRDRDRR